VKERTIQRAALYVADELFFSGTAAEITPIRSVDRISVGSGERGPITSRIQKVFFEITKGERQAPGNWLTYVNQPSKIAENNGYTGGVEAATPKEPVLSYQTAPSE
jgi:branched-chain amino acid aminotransferase